MANNYQHMKKFDNIICEFCGQEIDYESFKIREMLNLPYCCCLLLNENNIKNETTDTKEGN